MLFDEYVIEVYFRAYFRTQLCVTPSQKNPTDLFYFNGEFKNLYSNNGGEANNIKKMLGTTNSGNFCLSLLFNGDFHKLD